MGWLMDPERDRLLVEIVVLAALGRRADLRRRLSDVRGTGVEDEGDYENRSGDGRHTRRADG